MIHTLTLVVILITLPISGHAIGEEETLMTIGDQSAKKFYFGRKNYRKPTQTLRKKATPRGNLPPILVRKGGVTSAQKRKNPIQFPKLAPINRSGMDIGDIFDCLITQDIKAYAGSISPIKAEVLTGDHKGLVFIGNATMDAKTKDIVIEFHLARDFDSGLKHKLKATLHSNTGGLGLKGTHHSRYWQFFFANILSRGAQGYAQASVQRDRNIFGTYQEVPSVENAGKVAVAEAAAGTADEIADQMRQLPEYVTKSGPIRTKIFITETPKLIN